MPKAVREALGARPGDELEFWLVAPRSSWKSGTGGASSTSPGWPANAAPRVPGTAAELDELVERGMAEAATVRATRSRRR